MNPLLIMSMAAGLAVGSGLAVAVTSLRQRRPSLAEALARLDERIVRTTSDTVSPLVAVLRQRPGRIPLDDLRLLGWTSDRFLLARAGAALRYAAAGPLLGLLMLLLDIDLPIAVPGGFTLAAAVVGWTGTTRRVEQQADAAREELRFALVSYLHQVSLLRQGGAGVATALGIPARVLGEGWAMRRIADELAYAERAGLMPWEGLRRFGERVGVKELADLSAIAASAGHDGGAVIDTLLARAESLRDELLADEHADAHRASGQMSTPGALQVFLISAWVLYPAGVALLSL